MYLDEEFRIERVDPCRLISHSDFMTLPHVYIFRRLHGGDSVRVRLPLRKEWHVGQIVRLAVSTLLASAV